MYGSVTCDAVGFAAKEGTMLKQRTIIGACATLALIALTGTAQNSPQLVERYTDLAGSTQNATALVTGLRDGSTIPLKSPRPVPPSDAPTQKMGGSMVVTVLPLFSVM